MDDRKIIKWFLLLLLLPLILAFFSEDRFRYPCQNPENWDKDICKLPLCEVTRTCPEYIFKGQKDPRNEQQIEKAVKAQGENCGE